MKKYINKNITDIPQVFTVYKEVLDIYDNGLKIPDDVTIVWPDDNYGYIQRLSNEVFTAELNCAHCQKETLRMNFRTQRISV